MEIHETTLEPGFEPVRAAFERCFTELGDVGASVCVYRDGFPIVDLCGGIADAEQGTPWEPETLALVFSATKGIAATCIHRLVQAGKVELDAPVASYWPEFGENGKSTITIRHVLTHQAGVAEIPGDLTLREVFDWDPVCNAIAAQPTQWEPGTKHGYHARSFGWILGEVVKRATGRSFGSYLAEEIAAPLALEFYVGCPKYEGERIATTIPSPPPEDPKIRALHEKFLGPETVLGRVLSGPSNLFEYGPMWNDPELRAAEMPSSNGIANAHSLARFYAATIGEVDGFRILEQDTMTAARQEQVSGPDAVILVPMTYGLGFILPPTLSPECGSQSFGHPGAGGALGFADPEAGIAFGYAMNQMHLGLMGDERTRGLVKAVYDCLGRAS